MAERLYSANISTTITNNPLASNGTSITLATGTGSLFKPLTNGNWELALLFSGTKKEIVKITGITGDTLTVVRAQNGTTAHEWAQGSKIGSYGMKVYDTILRVDSIHIPFLMGYELNQDWKYDSGQFFVRMQSGLLKQQSHFKKLITEISGTGFHSPPLASIDRTITHTIDFAIPLAIYGSTTSIAIPKARRTDSTYEPYAFAHTVDAGVVPTSLSIASGGGDTDTCTLQAVTNAFQYSVEYFPKITAYITDLSQSFNDTTATWSWSMTAREQ